LFQDFNIDPILIEKYYLLAKLQYETGKYLVAAETLKQYQSICPESDNSESIQWGLFSISIINALNGISNWDASLLELQHLQSSIDTNTNENSLHRRLWFLHWSLFIFFQHAKGRDYLIEIFFQEKNLNLILMRAPYLIRYIGVSLLICPSKSNEFKKFIKIIKKNIQVIMTL